MRDFCRPNQFVYNSVILLLIISSLLFIITAIITSSVGYSRWHKAVGSQTRKKKKKWFGLFLVCFLILGRD